MKTEQNGLFINHLSLSGLVSLFYYLNLFISCRKFRSPYLHKGPIHYQTMSYNSGTKHTVAMEADRHWLHNRTVSCIWWEQCMLHSKLMVMSKSVYHMTVPDGGLRTSSYSCYMPDSHQTQHFDGDVKVCLLYDSAWECIEALSLEQLHTVWWWRQSLSIIWQCLMVFKALRLSSYTLSDGDVKVCLSYDNAWWCSRP